jgi:hypothetical protein
VIPEKHGGALSDNRRDIPGHGPKIRKAGRDHLALVLSPDVLGTEAAIGASVPPTKEADLASRQDDARRAHLKQPSECEGTRRMQDRGHRHRS